MFGLSAQPANFLRQKNLFQVALLFGLISILIFVLVLDALSLMEKFHIIGGKKSQDATRNPKNILVLFDIYKEPYDQYIIYQAALDGSGEKEIWSQSIKNTYQFSPISYPDVSNDWNYLFYPASFDPPSPEKFTIINSKTGEVKQIPNHLPNSYNDYAANNCLWNHSDTRIACEFEDLSQTPGKSSLVLIDVKDGTSTILYDSTKDNSKFTIADILGWDKNDENIFVIGYKNNGEMIYKIDINSKKITPKKGLEEKTGIGLTFYTYYSAQLNKFVYLDGEKTLKIFNPDDQTVKLLYENPDHYINAIFLTEDGKSLIFREDDFVSSFDQPVEPKDGVPTSKIMKLNLVNGKKQEFDYPFDPKKYFLSQMEHYAGGDVVIISNFETTSVSNPNDYENTLYAYNLSSKKLTKIFSRSNKDYPDKQIQFGVIRD
ncbi:MAG: hypothetical protein A2Z24_01340 [Candidatus Woykebacteria bacterium RBG_16_44_10]|uniref:DUF5050 domain-containing protein n=1 Tax=Candidatus Woykebacteria bacterium RBG_16_44_10 TaxID=1802597 RepID=A0A1G1WER5_9BACT|nr:MAG: hypothetical protein A2Z24_01340 [Candidatus Woykebacteria bacterium RBG_16_44_10]